MNCKEVIEFLAEYLDGTLPWRQRVIFALHLALCWQCRAYLASYRTTVKTVGAEGAAPAEPEPVPAELVQAILAATKRATPER